ncbi:hypothetical protein R3X27_18910 [Tropicimonas sp. TH_r6]|uniref:hypothetical protein n=1 Tax=Tropicimonas sp. TH_r6 TaxID=3082085 RepID=UPI002954BC4B|nr:hypothetical protein [Tropicimonas sp. TH_r6]MDV7144757.1 hypothetical protein [Tropicimonas sp. TH_r6]
MTKHLRSSKPLNPDKRYLGHQERFSFPLASNRGRLILDVFAVDVTGEVFASLSDKASGVSTAGFLEKTVLPVYVRRGIRLRAVQTDAGSEFSKGHFRDLLEREQITQVILAPGGSSGVSPSETFTRAFYAEFCDMGRLIKRYRSASDLRGDFDIWLSAFNSQRKLKRRLI